MTAARREPEMAAEVGWIGRACSGAPDSGSQPGQERDVSFPRLNLGKLRQVGFRDYAIRFALGGIVSVIASLLGQWVTQRFGGIFTAFPAILLASLTLIGEHSGREESAEDAEGGVAGALALVVMAVFLSLTLTRVSGLASLSLGMALWLALAVGIYALAVRAGWLRTRKREEQPRPGEGQAADHG